MKYKILQLGKHYAAKGGIETVTQLLVQALQNGRQTDVLCFGTQRHTVISHVGNSTIWEAGCFYKLSTAPISFSFFSWFRTIRNKYDIVLVHAPNPLAAVALWLFPCQHAKVVVQWHGDILNKGWLYKGFRFIESKLLRRANLILTTTTVYAQHSAALKHVASKIKVVPLGIDEQKLLSSHSEAEQIKKRYHNKKIVFALGRFVPFKGFEYLIEAAQHLPDNIVIVIGGNGRLMETYKKLIANQRWQERVFLVPDEGQTNWGSYYEACSAFCLPSIERSESFGLVLLEAMAFSKPCIATSLQGSGMSWVNLDSITGYNVPPKDSLALAGAIVKIISGKNYQSLCANANLRFKEHFTHTAMIGNLIAAFDNLIAPQKPVKYMPNEVNTL